MRKTPEELTGPFDNIILDIVEKTSPIFKKLNFTPNMLTTVSLITGLISMYYFYHNKPIHSSILYLLSYLFDSYDGHYARKYNMVTKFGDYYDHIKDISIALIFFYLAYTKCTTIKRSECTVLIIIGIVLLLMSTVHMGCQEVYYDQPGESDSLEITKKMCPERNKKKVANILRRIKFFSVGTFVIYMIFLMNWLIYRNK